MNTAINTRLNALSVFGLTTAILDVPQSLHGVDYLTKVAENIWNSLGVNYIIFGYALEPDHLKIQTVVVFAKGKLKSNFVYDLEGTPCQVVFTGNRVCIHPEKVSSIFPKDEMLVQMGVESYIGAPTIIEDKLFGLVAILDDQKIEDTNFYKGLIEFIAARISVELERYTHQHRIEELKRKSELDPLTNCLNRRAFEEAVTQIYFKYSNSSLMFVDADHFKNINDTKGHQYGDEVLKFIANTINESCREGDIVCRFGGEEFLIYLPNIVVDSVLKVSERIHTKLRDNSDFNVTVSIGITNCSEQDIELAIKKADQALYQAKSGGRNRTEFVVS